MSTCKGVVTLDVGGTLMKTYYSTLQKLEYFKVKLDRWTDKTSSNDTLFIDYDPQLFRHLLNKLRNDAYDMPSDNNIVEMCNYFGYPLEIEENNIVQKKNPIIYQPEANCYSDRKVNYECNGKIKIIGWNSMFNEYIKHIRISTGAITILDLDNFNLTLFVTKNDDSYKFNKKIIKILNNYTSDNIVNIGVEFKQKIYEKQYALGKIVVVSIYKYLAY